MDDLEPGVAYSLFLVLNKDGTMRILAKLHGRPQLIDVTDDLRAQLAILAGE